MKVLVDTSVWIDHLRTPDLELIELLKQGLVLQHPFVIGELSLGRIQNKSDFLNNLRQLPESKIATHKEVFQFAEIRSLASSGIGWIDAHLLASCVISRSSLFTKDKSLRRTAESLSLHVQTKS
ncbi:twitching motility protein PilT [Leptospira perolatii]|uniref:Twitching motility protein PilT n=1 Tax=Leptospira perolatii TaxID=2023191 RepID=A0A2M9ZSP3_9LEPT|nr:PIN domain-containing protein [Leptospira perolatii]PJZ68753.1 twitching motility protein PilT [Leptospira perolatii]PJZ75108.1 twitching motility protein PilT [Leptospira perolatii]